MFGLFKRKKTTGKPKAVAFVDYEHWFISLDKMYNARPDIKAWRDDLSQKYEMQEIIFLPTFPMRRSARKYREYVKFRIIL